jgi:hypothetical protein
MRMLRVPAVWAALVLLAILGFAGTADAQGIQLGPFRLLPSLELSVEYDDNIQLTRDNKIDDVIFHVIPGIMIELPSRRYTVRLGYTADVLRYADSTDLDTVHHSALADARVKFTGGLGFRLIDRFLITDDFSGFPVPELTERVERWENTLDAGADYTVRERYTFDVNYRWFMVDYRDDPEFDQFDRDDHTIAGTFFYRVFPKTSVLGEVDYNIVRYDQPAVADDRDSDAWRFLVGAKGDITAKTSVLVKVGWEWRDYENPSRDDWDGFIAEGNIIWKYREPSEVRLFGGRANVESLEETRSYYITNYAGIEVRHFLSERLILRVRGLGGVNDYPEEASVGATTTVEAERSDTFFEAGGALRYQMRRWLAFELAYAYRLLDSNFSEFDYGNNRVSASVQFRY